MKYDINNKLENIKKSGLFTIDQIGVIEYAIYIPGINIDLILNPTIPSEYMSMYIRLMLKGIDVTKYIKRNWELIEIPVVDLEKTILSENKNVIDKPKQKVIRRNI